MAKHTNDPFQLAIIKWFEDKCYKWHERRDIVVTYKIRTKTYTLAFQNLPIENLVGVDPYGANDQKVAICTHVRMDFDGWVQAGSWISRFADTSCHPNNGDFAIWAGELIEGTPFALGVVKALHKTVFNSSSLYIANDLYTLIGTELQAWKRQRSRGDKTQHGNGGCMERNMRMNNMNLKIR